MELNKEQIPAPAIEGMPDKGAMTDIEKRKENLARLRKEIEELRKFRLKSGYIEMLGDTRFGYRNEECAVIEKIINDFDSLLLEIEQDVEIHLGSLTHLEDIIKNPLMAEIAYTNRIIKKLENTSRREDMSEEEYQKSLEDILSENEKKLLLSFKEVTDYLIYFFGLIKNNRDILLQECGEEKGWLDSFKENYNEGVKLSNINVFSQLQDINFFSRLTGREITIGNRIKGMETLCQPIITEEEFEEAFGSLDNKDDLNREKIKQNFLGKTSESAGKTLH